MARSQSSAHRCQRSGFNCQRDKCEDCRGAGPNSQRHIKLNVKIPAGVDTGNRISLRGEGEAGLGGGPRGDLLIDMSASRNIRCFNAKTGT